MTAANPIENPFRGWTDLALASLGGVAVRASDDFFADRQRMLQPQSAVFVDGKYDANGKWMDGWESRRKRGPGHDFCIVRLGLPGELHGVDIDTSHFTGNYPPAASIDACFCAEGDPPDSADWIEVLPSVSLQGNSHHFHEIHADQVFTHLRLNIYPDGGVARLRVYGRAHKDWSCVGEASVDLAAVGSGGRAIACNNEHFGRMGNLIMPGRGVNMGDGWETRRRREPGNDWVILALGCPGRIERVLVDTAHFKGNYPDRCSIQAARVEGGSEQSLVSQSLYWEELLAPQKLGMDREHEFIDQLRDLGPVTHVRFNIHPDGGVSRLRLFGRPQLGQAPA